jgi:hypothetical protein
LPAPDPRRRGLRRAARDRQTVLTTVAGWATVSRFRATLGGASQKFILINSSIYDININ